MTMTSQPFSQLLDHANARRTARLEALWRMTAQQRVDAMRRGDLTLEQCCAWAARHPEQVPLLHDEFEFIAAFTPEARE
jgi:hypothetical protein